MKFEYRWSLAILRSLKPHICIITWCSSLHVRHDHFIRKIHSIKANLGCVQNQCFIRWRHLPNTNIDLVYNDPRVLYNVVWREFEKWRREKESNNTTTDSDNNKTERVESRRGVHVACMMRNRLFQASRCKVAAT